MRPRRLGRRPSRLGAARRAPQGDEQQQALPRRAPRPGFAHHSSSPPGLTRWSMLIAVLETHRPIRLSLPSAWIAGSSPAMTKEKGPRKKEAERRQTCSANLRILRCGACPCLFRLPRLRGRVREGACSPIGVPPRLLLQRANAAAQLQIRTSWDLVGRSDPKASNNRVRKTARFLAHDPEKWLPVFR